ncbi:MAG: DUF2231 domain-containing protein [Gemmataceae bacterium]|nr:DUF2231 domain-containing protein [Gemmataceae bacterium]
MDSRVKFLGHSIHQILIVFPLGLLATACVFDAVHLANKDDTSATVAFWMLVSGIVGGLVAAPFGTIDWLAIPANTRAKRIGLYHGLANVVALVMFVASAWLRWDAVLSPPTSAYGLSFGGLAMSLLGGWLGGELVARLGVGVDDGAHLDAPNSLSGKPARSAP